MVVGKSLGYFHLGTQSGYSLLETFGAGNTAHGSNVTALEMVEGKLFASSDVLPMQGGVAALDDAGGAVEPSQSGE